MKKIKFIFLSFGLLLAIALPLYYFFFLPTSPSIDQLYDIEDPVKKEIKQTISATGVLKLKNLMKIHSEISGRITQIHVEENDTVREGQLLAEIDTGFGDTEVREAQAAYEKGLAELEYHQAKYQRNYQLFKEHFISEANLQETKKDYQTSMADVKALMASYEKKQGAYEYRNIYAPSGGMIIDVGFSKGEKISADVPDDILFSLAPDVNEMEVELEIHEKDIGQIQKGQRIEMVVDTYPNKIFESVVQNISFISKSDQEKECLYQAKAYIENPALLLRPGMNVHATVDVASVDSVIALTSHPFLVKKEPLEKVAKLLNYSLKPLTSQDKQALLKAHHGENMQFVWRVCDNCFQELPIQVGLTDHLYFEVKNGLKGDEKLVAEVVEDDEMQKIYEKIYRKF